jgi:hypothetical protein
LRERGSIGAESSLVKGCVSGREKPGRHDRDLGLALEVEVEGVKERSDMVTCLKWRLDGRGYVRRRRDTVTCLFFPALLAFDCLLVEFHLRKNAPRTKRRWYVVEH